MRDPRVLFNYADRVEFRPVPKPTAEVPLTIVVVVDEKHYFEDTLRSLVLLDYTNFNVVVVSMTPRLDLDVQRLLAAYRERIPLSQTFYMKSAGWEADALNAAIRLIETHYWCWMRSKDVLHPQALNVMAQAIAEHEADYYHTCRFQLQRNLIVQPDIRPFAPTREDLWSGDTFPYDMLITYKMSAVVELGGFASFDRYPCDTAWIMAYKMAAANKDIRHVNASVYFEHMRPTPNEAALPHEYRKALIAQHWPEHHIADDDEDIKRQLLAAIEEETGIASETGG
jgi:hypothetical protein